LIRGTGAATYYTSFCGKGIDKGGVVSKLKPTKKFVPNKIYMSYVLLTLKMDSQVINALD